MTLHLSKPGVLPSQMLVSAIKDGWVTTFDGSDIPDQNIQPASLDLRLGTVAYRLRCSFLPDNEPVEEALRRYKMEQIKPRPDGSWTLEQNRPYLIPLVEQLSLPEGVRAKANPKSSTGRLDIFTRVITDNSFMFDEVPSGYHGRLYLEIVSRTFTVRVQRGLSLNQLRLMSGRTTLGDDVIRKLHQLSPLLYRDGKPMDPEKVAVNNGLFMSLDLGRSSGGDLVGYSAKADCHDIDLSNINHYKVSSYWDEVRSEGSEHGARIILRPEKFYLLLSQESVKIPPYYAAEMTAYDPTSGELRTHYAGFFDPGFGFDEYNSDCAGSRAALEVRAHDVQFAVEHGQNICKLSFDEMIEPPERLYGNDLHSNYQGQQIALGKHFKRKEEQREHREGNREFAQPSLFLLEEATGATLELFSLDPPRKILTLVLMRQPTDNDLDGFLSVTFPPLTCSAACPGFSLGRWRVAAGALGRVVTGLGGSCRGGGRPAGGFEQAHPSGLAVRAFGHVQRDVAAAVARDTRSDGDQLAPDGRAAGFRAGAVGQVAITDASIEVVTSEKTGDFGAGPSLWSVLFGRAQASTGLRYACR